MSIYERKIQSMKDAAKELIYSEKVSKEDKGILKELYHEICDYAEFNPFKEFDKRFEGVDSKIWNIAREYDMGDRIATLMDSWAAEEDINQTQHI